VRIPSSYSTRPLSSFNTCLENWRPGNKWEYIPFNYGPRICIGQAFANFQMEYFFVRLCQEFESITLLQESKSQEGLMRLELNTKTAHPILTKSVRVARG
jgi:cytochrome P450